MTLKKALETSILTRSYTSTEMESSKIVYQKPFWIAQNSELYAFSEAPKITFNLGKHNWIFKNDSVECNGGKEYSRDKYMCTGILPLD